MTQWMQKVGEILCPLVDDYDFSRGNSPNVMGLIEEKLGIDRAEDAERRKQISPIKQLPAPQVEIEEHHQKYSELLSYDKMKEFAEEYIKVKKV